MPCAARVPPARTLAPWLAPALALSRALPWGVWPPEHIDEDAHRHDRVTPQEQAGASPSRLIFSPPHVSRRTVPFPASTPTCLRRPLSPVVPLIWQVIAAFRHDTNLSQLSDAQLAMLAYAGKPKKLPRYSVRHAAMLG